MKKSIQALKWDAYRLWLDLKMNQIRRKETIRFLFIVQIVSQWKTELLYKAMLEHPRFEPILAISKNPLYPGIEEKAKAYCSGKGYPFIILDSQKTISEQVKVDILAHQKPYGVELNALHGIDSNRTIPTIYIPYYLSTITEEWVVNSRQAFLSWRQFVDFESCREEWSKISRVRGRNYAVTGLPIMDELLIPKSEFKDVWPVNDSRKRIIYAPHHTIADYHWKGIGYSTFLDYSRFMLEMRDKYQEQVYFVFKPHPRLFDNLVAHCGEEEALTLYGLWRKPGCSHVEVDDQYVSLFKHSDAMIHDCGSFTLEYLYTGNPVMYLVRDEHHKDNMTSIATHAFDLHYKGLSREDIETFIQNVIKGIDPLAEERRSFLGKDLQIPYGKSACDNIIAEILGDGKIRQKK